MGYSEVEREEPLSPLGRLFLTPEMHQICHCIMGCQNPIDVAAVTSEIAISAMIRLPRFSSLLVRDSHGREHWRKTKVDVGRHVVVVEDPVSGAGDEEAVNDYVADLSVSTPLSSDKPLWEVHLLRAHNCIIIRTHHALGDGVSIMSMVQEWCPKADKPDHRPNAGSMSSNRVIEKRRLWLWLWKVVVGVLLGLISLIKFLLRALWVKDKKTAVSGGAGVELWPRKLVTAKFWLDDMKAVKKAVADATINDVLLGIVSFGLSRYLDLQSPKALQDGVQITGLAMANVREPPGLQELSGMIRGDSENRWGNKFGMLLVPFHYHQGTGADPLQHVKIAKQMMDQKKQSYEAHFTYNMQKLLMSLFGPKVASWLNYRIVCNTTFLISNMPGPKEQITIAGNPVKFLRGNITSLSHAITLHMLSYAGRAEMQILVAKDIIPDPQVLAKCFEDTLHQMKEAAATTLV